jgi:hypothetical protein
MADNHKERFFMYWRLPIIAAAAGFILCATAQATVVTQTWLFGGNPAQVANGTAYSPTSGTGTITVYADQSNSSGLIGTPYKYNNTTYTESGLFQVNDSVNNHGVGIAPYNPTEGTSGAFSAQDGLTDTVHDAPAGTNNFIMLNLGSNIAAGTTISFLLQAGVSGDTFDVYTQSGATTPTKLGGTGGMVKMDSTPIKVDETGSILSNGSSQPTKPQFSIVKTAGVEWVAISADCHYLLLDSITGTPSAVPEPRFYGLLMAGMLGLAAVYARKRQAALPTPSAL